MKKEQKLFIKSIGIFILFLSLSGIIATILEVIFHIKIDSLSNRTIYLLSFLIDLFFLSIILFAYRKTLKEDFINYQKNFSHLLETSLKYWLTGFIIMIISNVVIYFILKNNLTTNEVEVRQMIDQAPLYMIFATVLYAPFSEELIFRKGFKDIFNSKYLYIIMSGFTFGALHVISSISTISTLMYLIPYCALGFAFASLYYKTKNIFCSISMHLLHNAIAITIYLTLGSML